MTNQPSFIRHKKLASLIRALTTFIFGVSITFIVIVVFSLGTLRFLPMDKVNSFISSSSGSFGIGFTNAVYYQITSHMLETADIQPVLFSLLLYILFASILLAVISKQLDSLLKNVQKNKPFSIDNARYISIMGITMIIGSIVLQIALTNFWSTFINTFKISNIVINSSLVDVTLLLSGLLLIILGEIFKYGSYLQNEFDSTL